MQIILVYFIGFIISLLLLHGFKGVHGIDHYDPPHDEYHDDWDSNAQAYVGFSLMWPIFWFFLSIAAFYHGLIKLSVLIGKLFEGLSIKPKKTSKHASNKAK